MQRVQRLLLIEDDEEDILILQLALKTINAPVECIVETDAGNALQHIVEQTLIPLPDLIFLDLNMPKVGGMEILTALTSLSIYEHIPVVIHSSTLAQRNMEKLKELGVSYFLPKPSNFGTLCENLQELFRHLKIPLNAEW